MNTPYDITDLEDYLYDRMSPADRLAFQIALEADTLLSLQLEALRVQPKILALLKESVMREQLTAWKARYDKRKQTMTRNIRIGLVALGIGSAMVFFWWRQAQLPKTSNQLPAQMEQESITPTIDSTSSKTQKGSGMAITSPKTALFNPAKLQRFVQIADSLIAFNKPGQSHVGGAGKVDSLYNQALLLYETNAEGALLLLQQSAKINPENANVLRLQAYILYSLGQNEAAAKVYAELKSIPNSLFRVDAEKAEIACYLGLLPNSRSHIDSLLKLIINAREGVSESRKNYARKLLDDI